MNPRDLPLNSKPEPMPASGPRNCSRAAFRHGPLLLAIFVGANLFPVAGARAAEPRTTTLSTVVRFSDLDLVRPADQQVLRGRTGEAARGLCRQLHAGRNDRFWCAKTAAGRAAPQVRKAIAQAGARQMAAATPR